MSFYADRNYIHSKVHALHGYLLDRRDYAELAESGSMQKIHPALSSDKIKYDPMKAKEELFASHISVVQQLMHAGKYYHELLSSFLRIYELHNFRLLMSRAMGRTGSMYMWYDLGEDSLLERELLVETPSISEMERIVSSSYIGDIISPDFNQSCEYNESVIEKGILSLLSGSMLPFLFREKRELSRLTAALVVILEMTWSMRLEKLYNWNNETIQEYLIENFSTPSGRPFPEVYVTYWKNYFGKILERRTGERAGSHENEPESAELLLGEELHSFFTKKFYAGFDSINPLVSYLVLYTIQIRNLFLIIEGTRAGLDSSLIMKNVICGE